MRLLYLTDTHFRGTNPRSRLDDFPATQLAKLHQVLTIAREREVTAVLHGGDLFDRPDTAPTVVRDVMAVLSEADLRLYGVGGNHDFYAYNPSTLPRTMLGLTEAARLFQILRPGERVQIIDWNDQPSDGGPKVYITGQEFHAELDRRDPIMDYCVVLEGATRSKHFRPADADFHIHLTHGMLLEDPFPHGAHSLLRDVMPHTVADVTFGGHYHPGWSKVHEVDGRKWINPGALVRLGSSDGDYERQVQVVLLTLEKGQPVQVEFIPLDVSPAAAVLDRSAQVITLAQEQARAGFVAQIGDTAQFEVLEVQSIMAKIAENEGVTDEVRAEALRRIGIAQELLRQGEGEAA